LHEIHDTDRLTCVECRRVSHDPTRLEGIPA